MKADTTVEWEFADVGAKVLIDVLEVEENRRIVYEWASCGARSRTTIQLRADDPNTTVVTIDEAKFPMDHEGVKRAMGQTAGWDIHPSLSESVPAVRHQPSARPEQKAHGRMTEEVS